MNTSMLQTKNPMSLDDAQEALITLDIVRESLRKEIFSRVGKTPERLPPIDYSGMKTLEDFEEAISACLDGIIFYQSQLEGRSVGHTGETVDKINKHIETFMSLPKVNL